MFLQSPSCEKVAVGHEQKQEAAYGRSDMCLRLACRRSCWLLCHCGLPRRLLDFVAILARRHDAVVEAGHSSKSTPDPDLECLSAIRNRR